MFPRLFIPVLLAFALAHAAAQAQPTVVYVGDSLTVGEKGTRPYTEYVTLPPVRGAAWRSFNIAVRGRTLGEMRGDLETRGNGLFMRDMNVAVIWGGTNDFALYNTAPSDAFVTLRDMCAGERRLGVRVLVLTMLSRAGQDRSKNQFNALIRAYWSGFADGLVDVAAEPSLGANGAYRNPAYFADGIHLTDQGYRMVGAKVQAGIVTLVGAAR